MNRERLFVVSIADLKAYNQDNKHNLSRDWWRSLRERLFAVSTADLKVYNQDNKYNLSRERFDVRGAHYTWRTHSV